jgi:O-antigen ligase
MFPMTAAVLLPMCCIAPLGWCWGRQGRPPYSRPTQVMTALILAAVYLLINASWSLSPIAAARTLVLVFLMVGTLHIVLSTLPRLEEAPLGAMAAGALAGVAVAGTILCLEVLSDQLLRRLLIRLVPALQPAPQHVAMDAGHLAGLAPYLPNASISVLTLMFWPAALMATRLRLMRLWKHLMLGAAVVAVAAVLASEHATSQIALLGAGATFLLFRMRPKLAMPLVIAGWVAATLLVVPVVSGLFKAEAYRSPWLPESARHRVVIWGYTAAQIAESPVFGAGIGSGRALSEAGGAAAPVVPGTKFHFAPGLHSHNAYLQVWYETGAVGAFILLGLGLLVLRAVSRFPADVQPYLAATFSACALLVATAFAIWAPWFMASLAMAAAFAFLGAALREADAAPLIAARRATPGPTA